MTTTPDQSPSLFAPTGGMGKPTIPPAPVVPHRELKAPPLKQELKAPPLKHELKAPPLAQPRSRARRLTDATVVVAAPLLVGVTGALHPAESDDAAASLPSLLAHRTQWDIAHVTVAYACLLAIPAALALGRLGRGSRWSAVGQVLMGLGSAAMAMFYVAHGAATSLVLHDSALSRPDAVRLVHAVESNGIVSAVMPVAMLQLAGYALLAVGARRSRALGLPVAVLLGAAPFALLVTPPGPMAVAGLVCYGPAVVAGALVARSIRRASS